MSILFALLLAAVVAVLLMHVVQFREQHRETLRATVLQTQVDLLKAAAADPDLARAAAGPHGSEPGEARRHLFFEAQMTAWELQWRIGALSQHQLRAHASAFLAGEDGRRYWERTRTARAGLAGDDAKLRTFTKVFDDARQTLKPADARCQLRRRERETASKQGISGSTANRATPRRAAAIHLAGPSRRPAQERGGGQMIRC
ncbi:DUF6082 family protein [Streptomyces sp. NPDC086549]|uniref:DUF6082 family protein n=1 Tax=Streptomyces sp. NPDC086549 TaxID=3365752 RepID=UPI00380E1263